MPQLHTNRQFGIEIECFGLNIDRAVEVIQQAGFPCAFEGYNHITRSQWKVVTDSSVRDGFEVVSPILRGNEGLQAVKKVASALVRAGAKVDRRCGFHVHVNARDLLGIDILNCIRRYAAHEAQIDGFMPPSRRGTNNTYCRTMDEVVRAIESISSTASPLQIAQRIYERYYKLNVQAFARHGTIEFRQHSGTVDYHKMINWIIFCVTFVEDSRSVDSGRPVSARNRNINYALQARFRLLASLLDDHTDRYNVISGPQIAEALGISESMVPNYITAFRNAYPEAVISARRGAGYYRDCPVSLVDLMSQEPRIETVRVIADDQGIFASLPPEVASYFHERSMDLALSL